MLNIQSSENPSRGISVTDESGNREEILHIGCSIRPGAGLYLNVDVLNPSKLAENLDDVQAALTDFVAEAFARASSMGLPVPAVGGGASA